MGATESNTPWEVGLRVKKYDDLQNQDYFKKENNLKFKVNIFASCHETNNAGHTLLCSFLFFIFRKIQETSKLHIG